ncbi:MAG: HDOD domain-containing protein [Acidobacteria bacterium]|nr:HDOD domain-containing protein [Acidobacteriota bacterium]MBI3657922.1 HDOD domain-containing protein [Acidobacteriota bacterium]
MKQVLFVDDEAKVLEGLQRMLRSMRREWKMLFANGGQEALDILAKEHVNVIVTDMRMPGMDGQKLLMAVAEHYPEIIRIVLSGQSDQEMVLKCVGTAHQYLSKPCDPEILKDTVNRAFSLRGLLANDSLRRLVSRMTSLPSIPALYLELTEVLQSPNASIEKVGKIVSKDMGMAAKVLQLANSAFFGNARHICDPADAVIYLGLDTIKALAFSVNVFSQFEQSDFSKFSIDEFWRHSVATGAFAQRIAKSLQFPEKMIHDARMAGLLHDVGKLVLAANLPKPYEDMWTMVQDQGIPQWQAEVEVFGSTHAEVGAYLLWLWGLPGPIIEAIAFHHSPGASPEQSPTPLTAVHIGNAIELEMQREGDLELASTVDLEYLTKLGLVSRLPFWREILRQLAGPLTSEEALHET